MVEMKQVVVVRTDLGMGRGKIAAQAGHACVLGAEQARASHPRWFSDWWSGQAKVVLRVPGPRELEAVLRAAREAGLPCSRVTDAGLTQLSPGTVTCISIGPAPAQQIDRITGTLKLL